MSGQFPDRGSDGNRFCGWHFLVLAVLLVLPGAALYREFSRPTVNWIAGWVTVVSAIAYLMYARDKQQARAQGQRQSEGMLHLIELLGGWPGAFLAQRRLRHKSSKGSYQFVFLLIVGLYQFMAIDCLRGWPVVRHVGQFLG